MENITTHVGGCACNAAIVLAKLGVPAVLSCKVGRDSFGEFVTNAVKENGVDIRGIVLDEKVSTTVSIVFISSSGERSFLYNPGSTSALLKENIPEELVNGCKNVIIKLGKEGAYVWEESGARYILALCYRQWIRWNP